MLWSFAPHDISYLIIFLKPYEISSNGVDIFKKEYMIHQLRLLNIQIKEWDIYLSVGLHPFKEHRFVIIGSKGMITF